MYYTCAFTGHRDLLNNGFDAGLLERAVLELIENGTKRFLCGMAMGFDLEAAKCVIKYKKQYGLKLVACIPCPNQTAKFPAKDKKLYRQVYEHCDEVELVSLDYHNGCMLERNRCMVDNCDVLLSFLRSPKGGTFYTVNYARQKGKKIIGI